MKWRSPFLPFAVALLVAVGAILWQSRLNWLPRVPAASATPTSSPLPTTVPTGEGRSLGTATPPPTVPSTPTQLAASLRPSATPSPTALPSTAGQPSYDALLEPVPTGAVDVSIQRLRLGDDTFAYLTYKAPGQERQLAMGDKSYPTLRQFDEIYHWEGRWRRVFDSYDWAQALFTSKSIGPVVDARPQLDTAIVSARVFPLEPFDYDLKPLNSALQHLLVVEIGYTGGPDAIQHYSPTVAVLNWDGSQFGVLWSRNLDVRADVSGVFADKDTLGITWPAYLENEPLCCPTGQETVTLKPDPTVGMREMVDCVAKQFEACGYQTPTPVPTPNMVKAVQQSPALHDAVALVQRQGYQVPDPSTYNVVFPLRVLIGVRAKGEGNFDQKAFFFYENKYLGTDTSDPSAGIAFVSQDQNGVTLHYRLYRKDDALCCSSLGWSSVRFAWNQQLASLDPLAEIPPTEVRR